MGGGGAQGEERYKTPDGIGRKGWMSWLAKLFRNAVSLCTDTNICRFRAFDNSNTKPGRRPNDYVLLSRTRHP